jgi:hypothetical protein
MADDSIKWLEQFSSWPIWTAIGGGLGALGALLGKRGGTKHLTDVINTQKELIETLLARVGSLEEKLDRAAEKIELLQNQVAELRGHPL